MSRSSSFSNRWATAARLAFACLCLNPVIEAQAAGLVYVEADPFSLTPSDATAITGGTSTDNLWSYRVAGATAGSGFGTSGNIFESRAAAGSPENSPQLTQRISGLTPGSSYDFYAVFWTDKDENWGVQTGLTPGVLSTFTYSGGSGNFPVAGSQQAITAGAALWDVLPPPTDDTPTTIFTERPADPLIMLLGKAGTAVANGSGEVDVFIDDMPTTSGGSNRSWFDGVAYVAAGGISTLQATVNQATGALTLTNPTNTPFQIKAISVTSPAGSLNAPSWTPITGNRDGAGNGTFDADNWVISAPADIPASHHAVALAEAEATTTNGGTLAANGGTINFGNVWNKSHFQDLRIDLTLADDTLVSMRPQFTGTSYAASDFNLDGSINLADYKILLDNIHSTLPAFSRVEANAVGDVTGNGAVNFADFTAFRTAYEGVNGLGSFEALVAQIPEPASLGMLLSGVAIVLHRFRRRAVQTAAAAAVTGMVAGVAQAVPLLAVDVNSRTGEAAPPVPAGDNTVAGFNEFLLPAGSPIAVASATYGSYQVTMSTVNATGVPTGAFLDRDRTLPSTTPTLNQLYDDFVFAPFSGTGNVGAGGGINLEIKSGGALQPNKLYSVSVYAFDTSTTGGRTANWLDGNSLDGFAVAATFNGSTAPTTDEQYKFTANYRTDASGNLLLKARETGGAGHAVFLNGFEVNEGTASFTLEVNVTTGAMTLKNEFATALDLNYYEIRSAAGSLNVGGWQSIEDAEAGDPLGTGWDEATNISGNILSEMNLTAMTTLAGGASVPLGSGFTGGGVTDLRFNYAAPDGALVRGNILYVQSAASIPGDFTKNGTVNGDDLTKWKGDYGVNGLSDADNDGDSDGADFLIWQRNFGASASVAASAAVPEPVGCSLAALALGGVALAARRRQ